MMIIIIIIMIKSLFCTIITVIIYLTLLPWAGCETSLAFTQSKAGLNSEFSFTKTGYYTKVK